MADLFDVAAGALERRTGLGSLEARGTLRIALKAGGVAARGLSEPQLRAVLEKLMPHELEVRGLRDAEAICAAVIEDAQSEWADVASRRASDPDEIFRRMLDD
jgi:hypothetical protein